MSDIPPVPHVLPSSLVNQQVHRVDASGDRQPRKEHRKPDEDILDLHDMEEPEAETPASGSLLDDDEGDTLDIAV